MMVPFFTLEVLNNLSDGIKTCVAISGIIAHFTNKRTIIFGESR